MPEHSYGIIPIFKDGNDYQVLLTRSKKYGHWGFPKGHQEEGEDPVATARREFVEETGIEDVTIVRDLMLTDSWEFKRDGRRQTKRVAYWPGFVRQPQAVPVNNEVAAYAWLSLERAAAKLSFDSQRRILDQVKEYLAGVGPAQPS